MIWSLRIVCHEFGCLYVCEFAFANIFYFPLKLIFPIKFLWQSLFAPTFVWRSWVKNKIQKLRATLLVDSFFPWKCHIQTLLMTLFAFGLSSDCKACFSGTLHKQKTPCLNQQPKKDLCSREKQLEQKDDVWIFQAYWDFLFQSRTHILICQGSSTLNSPWYSKY